MAVSFEQRIADAESERAHIARLRDLEQPGSPEWEKLNGKMSYWSSTIETLRQQQHAE